MSIFHKFTFLYIHNIRISLLSTVDEGVRNLGLSYTKWNVIVMVFWKLFGGISQKQKHTSFWVPLLETCLPEITRNDHML